MSKVLHLLLQLLVVLSIIAVAAANWKHRELGRNIAREKQIWDSSKFDLNYVTKRKIPNGPDPIHNRFVIITIFK